MAPLVAARKEEILRFLLHFFRIRGLPLSSPAATATAAVIGSKLKEFCICCIIHILADADGQNNISQSCNIIHEIKFGEIYCGKKINMKETEREKE
mmetsp:Transcript_9605/g.16767  ORF Transcript_9605/g.16767 Transcript_9605/m.16767 type:complete len:96 (+) Transcript_9605:302-589(+)